MSRGISSSAGTARVAGGRILLAGLVVLLSTGLSAGSGCGREKKNEEPPATEAPAAPTPAKPGGASGKTGVERGKKSKPDTGAAAAAKPDAKKTASGKRGKKGEAEPVPPAIPDVPVGSLSDDQLSAQVAMLRGENARLGAEVAALVPAEPYILINTTLNRLSMKKGDAYVLKDAVISTGSNTELVDTKGNRRWFFSTPKGVHTVKKKMIAPVWVKPDWAFVEEGEPIPGAQAEERFEEGTLGKYGLYIGDGYLIHGTLFQRFLGQSVTHGCIRVGNMDLEVVYANASVGTKVYIY